jgi:hypothetical protein
MKRACLLFLCVTVLPAQQIGVGVQQPGQPQAGAMSFQPAQSLAVGRGGRGTVLAAPRAERGKPFSATATSQTTQTFFDGTHVSRTTTMVEYRDALGRVRTEITQTGATAVSIMIRDNVAGYNYHLDPVTKSALKTRMAGFPVVSGDGTGRGAAQPPVETAEELAARRLVQLQRDIVIAVDGATQATRPVGRGARINPNEIVEDLGTSAVNGVQARGTRITTIVPAGEIGNDREFRSIDERWFSSDLNLLIKSENTDPRFGKTTYELTNISRQSPDPALFQVPPDYSVSTGGRGR